MFVFLAFKELRTLVGSSSLVRSLVFVGKFCFVLVLGQVVSNGDWKPPTEPKCYWQPMSENGLCQSDCRKMFDLVAGINAASFSAKIHSLVFIPFSWTTITPLLKHILVSFVMALTLVIPLKHLQSCLSHNSIGLTISHRPFVKCYGSLYKIFLYR